MGGRGSSSRIGGGVAAFDIDMGEGSKSRFVVRKGKVYRETGDAVNIAASQLIKNAKQQGYDVTTYNSSQQKERESKRKADRKNTDKFLNEQWYKAGSRPKKGMKGH